MPVRRVPPFACVTLALLAPALARASADVPPAVFTDPARKAKLLAAVPEVEKTFAAAVAKEKFPGSAAGLVIDGELVWSKGWGARGPEGGAVDADTVFRIASMTKSFTALAVLKLRDEGRLSLDDTVAKWVPEVAALPKPTKDAPDLTLRHLLTHSEGFPEDNPWGDRQLARSDAFLSALIRAGIPFSNAPGVAFEYSNTGFAILGRVVANASGMRYRDYVDAKILKPLGMTSTYWEASAVPTGRLAAGMELVDGKAAEVRAAQLPDGSFDSMGGLYSTVRDLARYTAFFLSAWPPRDDSDAGPVKRSSVREMQQVARFIGVTASAPKDGKPFRMTATGYGYGLGDRETCRFRHVVSHAGGLPGFGSNMLWLPEHGVALVGLANLTYAGWGNAFFDALEVLHKTGALQARAPQPAPALLAARAGVSRLHDAWDDAAFAALAADNLVLDVPLEKRRAAFADRRARHGECTPGPLVAENALRGSWTFACEHGFFELAVTLAPTFPPRVQALYLKREEAEGAPTPEPPPEQDPCPR
jgi:CubicO group peptidase (beta-lactamase class C family)